MPKSESRAMVEPPLVLDRGSDAPLAAQITGQLRTAVRSRRLRAGERLPSSRALAASLGVSRTVVTNAYTQLFAEGWLEGRHGSGTYVAEGVAGAPPASPSRFSGPLRQATRPARPGPRPWRASPPAAVAVGHGAAGGGPPQIDLRPGVPWVPGIDKAAWRRAWRQAAAAVPSRWPDPRGLLPLRAALCAHLRRTRGLDCTPDHVLITRGVGSGLGLLAATLLRPGDRAGIEDPGYAVARSILTAWGAQVTPCPVDSHGLVTGGPVEDRGPLEDRGLPGGLRLMYVTPAHQYPLGGRLPVPRRQALVAWARASGALIVEDDYDSEFRYDVAPLPALYGLDPDAVAYLGTTAKTLTPTFGVGWLAARPDLVAALADTRENQGDRTSESAQRALLAMIESGDLDRHIRRMRRVYARRRDTIVSILGDPAVPGTLRGDTAGLHVVLELPGGWVDEVVAAARLRGLVLHTLDRYVAGPSAVRGLVLGYGAVPERQVATAATVLRDVLLGLAAR